MRSAREQRRVSSKTVNAAGTQGLARSLSPPTKIVHIVARRGVIACLCGCVDEQGDFSLPTHRRHRRLASVRSDHVLGPAVAEQPAGSRAGAAVALEGDLAIHDGVVVALGALGPPPL